MKNNATYLVDDCINNIEPLEGCAAFTGEDCSFQSTPVHNTTGTQFPHECQNLLNTIGKRLNQELDLNHLSCNIRRGRSILKLKNPLSQPHSFGAYFCVH